MINNHDNQMKQVNLIVHSLKYLRESLSNYIEEDEICKHIWEKLLGKDYGSEIEFIEQLEDEEVVQLNHVLEKEIDYAHDVQDEVRIKELNDIYELLL